MQVLNQKSRGLGDVSLGSFEVLSDKAAWIRRTFLDHIPKKYPRIKAVIWFDADKETDWRVTSSRASRDAYRRVAADARYGRRFI